MMRIKSRFPLWPTLLFLCLFVLCSCNNRNTPPTLDEVTIHLQQHKHDISVVLNYFSSCSYEDVFIQGPDSITADLKTITVPLDVESAINRLLSKGNYLQILKDGNTVSLLQWIGSKDISCGIACSLDLNELPTIQFVTELKPISDTGWYYYVADYEQWRET